LLYGFPPNLTLFDQKPCLSVGSDAHKIRLELSKLHFSLFPTSKKVKSRGHSTIPHGQSIFPDNAGLALMIRALCIHPTATNCHHEDLMAHLTIDQIDRYSKTVIIGVQRYDKVEVQLNIH